MLLFKEGTNIVVGSVPLKPVQDKPRTSILSRRLRGSVELKIFYGIAALGLTQDLVPISSRCLSTCPSLSTLSPIAFSEGFSMVPHLELCAAPDSPNKRRSNMSAAEEKGEVGRQRWELPEQWIHWFIYDSYMILWFSMHDSCQHDSYHVNLHIKY